MIMLNGNVLVVLGSYDPYYRFLLGFWCPIINKVCASLDTEAEDPLPISKKLLKDGG
jgi:hypothetical protein